MALTDGEGMNTTMLVGPAGYPAYQNNGGFGNGFGGDWGWIILLLLLAGNGGWGMGGGFGGGYANMQLGYDFPWLMNGQQGINNNVSDGFRDAQLHDSVTSVRDGISSLATQLCSCCGDISQQLCSGFAGVTASVTGAQNAVTQQLYTNQIADLNRSFDAQTATTGAISNLAAQQANCCCENRLATCQTQNIIQNEGNQTRFADANNTRDIIDNQNRNSQAIMDKLCVLELDGVKNQLAQAQRENVGLQNQLSMATLRESQTAQNAFISQGFANEVDQLYNRLSNCPVPSTPVYGRTPIFTCNQNQNCGCGCGQF